MDPESATVSKYSFMTQFTTKIILSRRSLSFFGLTVHGPGGGEGGGRGGTYGRGGAYVGRGGAYERGGAYVSI